MSSPDFHVSGRFPASARINQMRSNDQRSKLFSGVLVTNSEQSQEIHMREVDPRLAWFARRSSDLGRLTRSYACSEFVTRWTEFFFCTILQHKRCAFGMMPQLYLEAYRCSQPEKAFARCARNSALPCVTLKPRARASPTSIATRNFPFLPADCPISRPKVFCPAFTAFTPCR